MTFPTSLRQAGMASAIALLSIAGLQTHAQAQTISQDGVKHTIVYAGGGGPVARSAGGESAPAKTPGAAPVQSQNNIKQLGLAAHNYESASAAAPAAKPQASRHSGGVNTVLMDGSVR